MKTIKPNTTLTARSVCNHDCVFTLTVISRTPKTATVKDGEQTKRTKIHTDTNGDEYLRPESYSMAPIYRAK